MNNEWNAHLRLQIELETKKIALQQQVFALSFSFVIPYL